MPNWQVLRPLGFAVVMAAFAWSAGCGGKPAATTAESEGASEPETASEAANIGDFAPSEYTEYTGGSWPDEEQTPRRPPPNLKPEVAIKTSRGEIVVRLDAEKAPVTVDNFLVNYVDSGFYEDTVFHYVEKGNLIAAGGYTAELEPKEAGAQILNEANNGLKNRRGTIAMVRLPDYAKSATSQFFFNLVDNPALDHKSEESDEEFGYCVFGEVIEGLDVLDQIADSKVQDTNEFPNVPVQAVRIEAVRRLK